MASSSAGRIFFRDGEHAEKRRTFPRKTRCAIRHSVCSLQATTPPLFRHPFILSPLAMLLLCSCEPGQDNAGAGNKPPRDDGRSQHPDLPSNFSNPERIAAQDSLGKPPSPHDLVSDTADICPVHHEKMRIREIPIVFEDTGTGKIANAGTEITAEFPFGAEKITSSANALLPGQPLSARVYQCASCIAARQAAEQMRGAAAPPMPVAASK